MLWLHPFKFDFDGASKRVAYAPLCCKQLPLEHIFYCTSNVKHNAPLMMTVTFQLNNYIKYWRYCPQSFSFLSVISSFVIIVELTLPLSLIQDLTITSLYHSNQSTKLGLFNKLSKISMRSSNQPYVTQPTHTRRIYLIGKPNIVNHHNFRCMILHAFNHDVSLLIDMSHHHTPCKSHARVREVSIACYLINSVDDTYIGAFCKQLCHFSY
mmetsp:Transcript_50877/g.75392  ORF Transcript_50877/g.75392 Transcript_50877/m.75392 type:complete len:211 (-) Transcript_50877:1263-1895(-)